jgi:hypothetical protein
VVAIRQAEDDLPIVWLCFLSAHTSDLLAASMAAFSRSICVGIGSGILLIPDSINEPNLDIKAVICW